MVYSRCRAVLDIVIVMEVVMAKYGKKSQESVRQAVKKYNKIF